MSKPPVVVQSHDDAEAVLHKVWLALREDGQAKAADRFLEDHFDLSRDEIVARASHVVDIR